MESEARHRDDSADPKDNVAGSAHTTSNILTSKIERGSTDAGSVKVTAENFKHMSLLPPFLSDNNGNNRTRLPAPDY